MKKKQKKMLIRIIITTLIMIALIFIPAKGFLKFLLYLIPYLVIGYDILIKAIKGIINRQVFDENFLMAIATIGALILGAMYSGDYVEAVSVMLFYQIGEFFQSYAVFKSRKNITELMDIRPDYANIIKDGKIEKVDPGDVSVGTTIIINPGEKVPIDGIIIEGNSVIDTSALTGESMPENVREGDNIISGSVNESGVLKVRTTKDFSNSTVYKILDLVENASSRKSKSEDFIAKFARVYTPIVCYLALFLAFIPPLFLMFLNKNPQFNQWIYRSLTFLIMSCPCALVISIPLSFFAGIGGASRAGVLVKGSNYLEALANTNMVVFDKTGTLTKGKFEVTEVVSYNIKKEELLYYAAYGESSSNHPISRSIVSYYNKDIIHEKIKDVKEISGMGIIAKVDNNEVIVGKRDLLENNNIDVLSVPHSGTVIYVAVNNKHEGYIVLNDKIKPNAKEAINELKKVDVKETVMLTGDRKETALNVSNELNITKCYYELLPQDKLEKIEYLISKNKPGRTICYVGDGINDAPVLARADIGIAMGGIGSDAAIEAADIVLMDDNPKNIKKSILIARKCMRIVYENIVFAIGIKVSCLILAASGLANMWLAIFADVGVMIIAVLNAIRALQVKNL